MTNPHSGRQPALLAHRIARTLPLDGRVLTILNDVSFSISRGAWVALTGPSGSGKSTLLGIVAGLDSPTSGRLLLDGVDIARMSEGELAGIRNEKVGMVFQAFNLIPTLTAQENVEVPLYVSPRKGNAPSQAREMLARVGLSERLNHRPNQLSGGEQQRVAIARALVTHPSLLVADEPTGNLDSRTGAAVLDLFAQLRDELDLTIVIATHDPVVAVYAEQRLHLVDGSLVDDPAEEGEQVGPHGAVVPPHAHSRVRVAS